MIQGGPEAMPQTLLYKQQAGGPMRVHPEQFPRASCMPMSLGDSPRSTEGKRLERIRGDRHAHCSRRQEQFREKDRVPPVIVVGGSGGWARRNQQQSPNRRNVQAEMHSEPLTHQTIPGEQLEPRLDHRHQGKCWQCLPAEISVGRQTSEAVRTENKGPLAKCRASWVG